MSSNLEEIKNRVKEMPAVSANTMKILNLIAKEDYALKDLSDLIELDISLTTKCLKIVNSAEFALRTEITSIERAVSYLGKQTILGMVIESGFSGVYNAPLEGYDASEGELWEHSLRTAIASRLTALKIKRNDISDLAYTSGLLHNMGKVILSEFLKNSGDELKHKFESGKHQDFSKVEKEILKTNHSEIGQLMAENWGIPKSIQMAILHHHHPIKAPDNYKPLCYIVHYGDILAMLSGGSQGIDAMSYEVDPEVKKFLSLREEEIDDLMFNIELEVNQAKEKVFSEESPA